jgi:DNA-binding response OmpR family regulator
MSRRSYHILIVNDEASLRRNIRAYLEDEGFVVMEAGSGEEGLAKLVDNSPDAAIVDIRLPGMDGNAFILQAHRLLHVMIFLIYTGSVDYEPPPSLRAIGISEEHVFTKPQHDLAVLASALRRLPQRSNS